MIASLPTAPQAAGVCGVSCGEPKVGEATVGLVEFDFDCGRNVETLLPLCERPMMHLRIWSTGLDEGRAEEYDEFALNRSLPMFRAQPGFCGLYLGRSEGRRMVFTFWENAAGAEALDNSPTYLEIVSEIAGKGFLTGASQVQTVLLEAFHAPETIPPNLW